MTSAVGEQQRRLWSSVGSGVSYGDIKGTEDWVQVVASSCTKLVQLSI